MARISWKTRFETVDAERKEVQNSFDRAIKTQQELYISLTNQKEHIKTLTLELGVTKAERDNALLLVDISTKKGGDLLAERESLLYVIKMLHGEILAKQTILNQAYRNQAKQDKLALAT